MKLKPTSLSSPCESPAQDTTGRIKNISIGKRILLNTAVGNRDLCAWQPVHGVVWVQTRNPNHARRLAQRKDGKLVAWGVAGGYLKTYEFAQSITWAIELMARYTAAEKATNTALERAICPETKLSTTRGNQ